MKIITKKKNPVGKLQMESKNEEILMNDNKSFKDQSINLLDSAQIDKIEIQKPKKKIFSNTYSSHYNLLDMVCCMNIHQERF